MSHFTAVLRASRLAKENARVSRCLNDPQLIADLIDALQGVMGLVQLISYADRKSHVRNHRYVEAERVLRELEA